jgi:hypothetical protein
MQLLNLNVDRIIIHQIFKRDLDGNIVKPAQSREYTLFEDSAMENFRSRVTDALGEGSKAVAMQIFEQDAGKVPALIDLMIEQDEETFAVSSYDLAKKLADAQHSKGIPGGIVVVFTGKQGASQKKFLGIIKAEVHSGYEKIVDDETGRISLKFVEEVLLTPGTRLYKTAGFYEKTESPETASDLNNKWAVMVSDHQINKADGKFAAQYFYSSFLGLGYPQTSARTTKIFYDTSKKFITTLDVPPGKKSDLLNALNTYLKVEESSIVSTSEFASRYFNEDTQDQFGAYMEEQGVPTTAFTKDTEFIKSSLKLRKVKFRSKVNISGPQEAFNELVTIDTIEGDADASGSPAEWTRVIIKDRISDQE